MIEVAIVSVVKIIQLIVIVKKSCYLELLYVSFGMAARLNIVGTFESNK